MPTDQEEVISPQLTCVSRKLRFGAFEADLESRSLSKSGRRIKLQGKPFQILELLLKNRGYFITRAELTRRLWPDLFVNFDHNLNTAVNALRKALGDSSQNSCFIETRSGLGYRFIAPVHEVVAGRGAVINPRAHEHCARARYFLNKLTQEDLHKGMAYYQAALAEDPGCGLAHAGLAETYCLFALMNMASPGEMLARAKTSAITAVEADPDLAEAHAALASVKRYLDWDWDGADGEFRRALELSASCAAVHRAYGSHLSSVGNAEGALEELRRAQELDATSPAVNVEAAWIRYLARDFAGAQEHCWKALVLEPKFAAAQHVLGLACEQMRMYDEALIEFQNAVACGGEQPAVVASLAHAYAEAGKNAEARETLERLRRLSVQRPVSPYWHAIVYAGLGRNDRALEWLAKARQDRDVWLVWLAVEPRLDNLRAEARFESLLNEMGLGALRRGSGRQ